jgi:hypothetical protein
VQLIAAAAHAECGEFSEAIRIANVAWRLAQSSNNAALMQQISARIKSYRGNKAWYEPK